MDIERAASALWAKSDAGGKPHSLVGHLLDTAAVAELIWTDYLAPAAREHLAAAAGNGDGKQLLVTLSALHDIGKATPAFQVKARDIGRDDLVSGIESAGLSVPPSNLKIFQDWHHGRAGAVALREIVPAAQWKSWSWAAPLIEGHHGRYGGPAGRPSLGHGDPQWAAVRHHLAAKVLGQLGVDLTSWSPSRPSRGVQTAFGGLIVMADWIASSDLFPGLGLVDVDILTARQRARSAWDRLGLDAGWTTQSLLTSIDEFPAHFGFHPRPLQALAVGAGMGGSGLTIIEAPMGEGKTEAALALTEMLAASSGAKGVFFAMPTQGTTDAMYDRVRSWMETVDPTVPVSLLHGKAMLNEAWVNLTEGVGVGEVHDLDEYGLPADDWGDGQRSAAMPSAWLAGRHRGLLASAGVATIDQVLWAATRTKFVALRHAGLMGRVLVIDEVHAFDAYMGVFLHELLRWCARMKTPVVLMSATLPESIRTALVNAWREGAGLPPSDATVAAYPSILSVADNGEQQLRSCDPYRPDLAVEVAAVPGTGEDSEGRIASEVRDQVNDGGVALAILNTVRRAQEVYRELRRLNVPAMLIHGRLTAAERADRTARAVRDLGPDGDRPGTLVIVATQIAEQSFDVDADVLFTDLAPMDLLLQRIGRLHRHDRPASDRPSRLQQPRVHVTGLDWANGVPHWPGSFADSPEAEPRDPLIRRTVYRPGGLLRSADALRAPALWHIPSEVPQLVAAAYSDAPSGSPAWQALLAAAARHETAEREYRRSVAATFRLDGDPKTTRVDLVNLHARSSSATPDDRPVVRDGEDSLEVILIKRVGDRLQSLTGTPLGHAGERAADRDVARRVLADSVRLRWRKEMAGASPLPQWEGLPFLTGSIVTVLDENNLGHIGAMPVRYDDDLGLEIL
ncbi:CRISPR-associated helicase/endonuclease Cas3 [Parenemella sanctibonifatiensis]|uniref:CRISPR-associated helicase/endonuclease Cas3 n=1 Tax=Parenemella sanctibonifatiensis TaxID=2016505 RepID=A0A255EII5_9ACTN|nr:CRISPR-associated helicase/endonuclease Cas3 [Parenemella sanctibonifatiensis]OYN89425.1 CRISPR-associated helicase/endonuclease Cas3 [Parenemella sanctibonifatiensis]